MPVNKVTECLGFVFCEFSFRWFDAFDVPYDERTWRWYHRVSSFIGGNSYAIGCWLYNLGGTS